MTRLLSPYVALALLAACLPSASAATLSKWQLVADRSSDPPGDRLDYTVLLAGYEQNPKLEVRPYRVLGDNLDTAKPILAKSDASAEQKDAEGRCVVVARLTGVGLDARVVDNQLTIPYAALDLPIGQHKVAYLVTVTWEAAGRVQSTSAATAVTTVTVTDKTRRVARMRPVAQTLEKMTVVNGHVVDKDTNGLPPRVVQIAVPVPMTVFQTVATDQTVEIPNEFARTPADDLGPNPNKSPKDNDLDALARRPWVATPKNIVYFATNRKDDGPTGKLSHAFGNAIVADVTYGSAIVTVPTLHKRGVLEEPNHWWQRRSPADHFVIEDLKVLTRQTLQDAAARKGDVLLFVHGYNNSFEDAIYRFAQVAYDLQFPGLPLAFCWPSSGNVGKYGDDETAAAASVDAMAAVIQTVVEKLPAGNKLHVIAHSMGNRVFLSGLAKYAAGPPAPQANRRPLGHVLLAAPDIDAKRFAELFPAVQARASTTTLYFNQNDFALKASRVKHLDTRVGAGPFFIADLANIDAGRANTSALGHGYYAGESVILVDIEMLVNQGLLPDKRVTLRSRQNDLPKVTFWYFP